MIYHIGFYLLCSVCRLPQWLSDKGSACNAGTEGVAGVVGSIPGSGRLPEKGNGNPLQYSCLGNPWTEEPGRLQSVGLQKDSDRTENAQSVCSPGYQQ